MQNLDQSVERTAFVWALGSLCQLHKIPFDAKLLLQQITPPYNIANLLNAGQQLGLKIQAQPAAVRDLTALPLPCLALMQRQTHDEKAQPESAPTPSATKIEPAYTDVAAPDDESQIDSIHSDTPVAACSGTEV